MTQSAPEPGYRHPNEAQKRIIAENLAIEKILVARLNTMELDPLINKRWLRDGRRFLQEAFRAINNAIHIPE